MPVQVTTLYAGLFGLLYLVLAAQVVRGRWRYKVGLGTGSEPGMERAVRVHANFAEYVPLLLTLMLLAELGGAPGAVLHGVGLVLLVSRLLHAWGLSQHSNRSFGRFYGTLGTWLALLGLSVYLTLSGLGAFRS
ncbi:MAG: MAPEG family protein [Gammaproteobacteria bacterium]|nr:MAPEG family protein [Gammaproteobacteria bacterium]